MNPVIRLINVANAIPQDRDTTAASESCCGPGRPVAFTSRPGRGRWRCRGDRGSGRISRTRRVARTGPVEVGAVGLAAEAVPQPSPGEQHQHRARRQRDEEQHLAVGVGVHRQANRIAERQPVGSAQRHVNGHPLGEVHFDRHPQREETRRQFELAHVRHRHPRRGVDRESHPDGDRQIVAQRQRQRAALGRQRVGTTRVDHGDRVEQIVDGRSGGVECVAPPTRFACRPVPTGSARAACPRAVAPCTGCRSARCGGRR